MKKHEEKFIEILKKEFWIGSFGLPNKFTLNFNPAYSSDKIFNKYRIVNFHVRFHIPDIKRSIDYWLEPSYINEKIFENL